jgi:hypothetical protein
VPVFLATHRLTTVSVVGSAIATWPSEPGGICRFAGTGTFTPARGLPPQFSDSGTVERGVEALIWSGLTSATPNSPVLRM